jgi:hypothetical protein
MRIQACALVALLAAACASESPGFAGPCAKRSGTYRTTYTKRSGSCPNFNESISSLTEQPTKVDAPCTGTIGYSEDNCRVTYDVTCPDPNLGAGYTQQERGVADWDQSASRGTAAVEIIVWRADKTSVCNGTYDVAVVRQ